VDDFLPLKDDRGMSRLLSDVGFFLSVGMNSARTLIRCTHIRRPQVVACLAR